MLATFTRCSALVSPQPRQPITTLREAASFRQQWTAEWSGCWAAYRAQHLPWVLAHLVLLLAVAGLIYWLHPSWRIRRRRLVPLTADDHPDLLRYLDDIIGETGLARSPRFLLDAANPVIGGVTFGRRGPYYVSLSGGLATKYATDRPLFRAVVLHELAHVRNRDVPKTYATNALWQAFVLTELLPFPVTLLGNLGFTVIAHLCLSIFALTALVYLTRSALLRSIESHADVRAAAWDTGNSALQQLLSEYPQQAAVGWLRVLRRHPDKVARRRTVEDPQRMFRLGFWEMLAAGLAIDAALWDLGAFSLPGHITSFRTLTVLSAMAALLIAGVLGTAVWRAVAFAVATGRPMPGVISPGIGLGTGFLFGTAVSFDSLGGTSWSSVVLAGQGSGGSPSVPATAIIALLGIAGAVLLAAWIRSCAQAWLSGARQPARNHRSQRWLWLPGLVATSIVAATGLTCWIAAAFAGEYMVRDFAPTYTETVRALVGGAAWTGPAWLWATVWNPVIFMALPGEGLIVATAAVLWMFPVAGQWRARSATLRLPVLAGVSGGAVSAVLLLALRLITHATVPPGTRSEPAFQLLFAYWEMGLVVAVQAVVAAVVAGLLTHPAGTGRSHPVMVFSLLAAFVTAMISLAAICLGLLVGGCVQPLHISMTSCPGSLSSDWLNTVLRVLIVEGAMAALIGGTLGIAGRRLLGHRRASQRSLPAPASRLTLSAPVILAAAMIAILAWCSVTVPLPASASPDETALDNSIWASPPPSTLLTAIAVRGWLGDGGENRIRAFAAHMGAVPAAFKKDDLEGGRTACAAIAHDSDAAASLDPVPDAEAQKSWSAVISASRNFAMKCVAAIDTDNAELLRQSIPQFSEASAELAKLARRMTLLAESLLSG